MTGTGVDKGTLEWPYGPLGLMPSECQVRSRAELPPSLLPPSMHKSVQWPNVKVTQGHRGDEHRLGDAP